MTSLIDKIKSLAVVLTVFSFLTAVTISSCTTKDKGAEDAEGTEMMEVDEAEGEEHPTDSLAVESESEEHPTDSEDGEEHPTEEQQ